jgi:hypothetical protein
MALYVLRARNSSNTAYVHWTSEDLDLAGVDAPSSILASTVVVEDLIDEEVFYTKSTPEAPIFDLTSSSPFVATNPIISHTIVQVDTADGDWPSGGIILLPSSPRALGRVTVKDLSGSASAKQIVIDGNGNNIDDSSTLILNIAYASVTCLFDGSDWVVI